MRVSPERQILLGKITTLLGILLLTATLCGVFLGDHGWAALGLIYGGGLVSVGSHTAERGRKRRQLAIEAAEEQAAKTIEQAPQICITGAEHVFLGVDAKCLNGCDMTQKDVRRAAVEKDQKNDQTPGGSQRIAGRDYYETNVHFGQDD